jgi:hypothetical protein
VRNDEPKAPFFHTQIYLSIQNPVKAANGLKPLSSSALFLNIQSENIPFDVPTLEHKYFNSGCHNSVNYWWSLMHAPHKVLGNKPFDERRECA